MTEHPLRVFQHWHSSSSAAGTAVGCSSGAAHLEFLFAFGLQFYLLLCQCFAYMHVCTPDACSV